jgi:hypothetical protein
MGKSGTPPKLKTPAQRRREGERLFRPVALEIGWISYEWNRLQEGLAELFSDILETKIAFAVWHSVRSDLAQREMLIAAVNSKFPAAANPKHDTKERTELLWLTTEAGRLSHKRNDALHVPFYFLIHADHIELLPFNIFGNPKAKTMAPKDLMKEFKWYRATAAVLANYAEILHYALTFQDQCYTWPSRPSLPHLGQSPNPKRSPHRKSPTRP